MRLFKHWSIGWFWVGRAIEKTAQEQILSEGDPSAGKFKIATKLIDMPLLGYRWNYTKAIQNETVYDWGDTVSEMRRASDMLRIDGAAEFTAPLRQAVEAEVFGGNGSLGPPAGPTEPWAPVGEAPCAPVEPASPCEP